MERLTFNDRPGECHALDTVLRTARHPLAYSPTLGPQAVMFLESQYIKFDLNMMKELPT